MSAEARIPLTSISPDADRIASLQSLFPEAFTEGKVDFERLKQALGESIQTDRERYGLNWAGKSDAIHVLQSLSVGTLQPQREESVNFDTTENLIIEGDNLEVLKLLQKSYFGKVKMIYIDPPYNTGNEFIYPDNFREGLEDYLRFSGQMSAEGTATTNNKETDGRYHSKWLSMMYPRLFLAKNLLREDGVIFVSIDDHELHNLRLMMNEVFGEENFLANVVWQKKYAPSNDTVDFSYMHDYIMVYGKARPYNDAGKAIALLGRMDRTEEQNKLYKNPDNDERGLWRTDNYLCNKSADERPNLYYPIIHPKTGEEIWPNRSAVWRYSKDRHARNVSENRVWWGLTQDNKVPAYKRLFSEVRGIVSDTWWTHKDCGHNDEAKKQLKALFPDTSITFDTPKPSRLIKRMVKLASPDDGAGDDIILDFFAGSGTTAQAVLELNQEDGGRRKFVLVQLPENTADKQFPTIATITRERVRRAIKRMNDSDAARLLPGDENTPDRGFKAFTLAASNFKIWEDEQQTDQDAIARQLELFADNLLPDAAPENILFEILLKAGFDLNISRTEIMVAGHPVQSIAGGHLLVCLERVLSRAVVDGMIAQKPSSVICLDEAFHGDDALLTNTLLQMQDGGIIFQTI